MKVVLSRKGFDRKAGGGPSPILPDGELLSLPIPEPSVHDCPRTPYDELRWRDSKSYGDVLRDLGLRTPGSRGAHLDPDLRRDAITRANPERWRPMFGQTDAAQTHLDNQGVGRGDVFLFFGWFRHTVVRDGRLCWDKVSPDMHVIFGYLEIGNVIRVQTKEDAAAIAGGTEHPHVRDWNRRRNTLYVAADHFTLVPACPGAGTLRFSDETRLSDRNSSKRSLWRLPGCFALSSGRPLSGHGAVDRWTCQADGSVRLRSVPRGQEFVVEAGDDMAAWVSRLVGRNRWPG